MSRWQFILIRSVTCTTVCMKKNCRLSTNRGISKPHHGCTCVLTKQAMHTIRSGVELSRSCKPLVSPALRVKRSAGRRFCTPDSQMLFAQQHRHSVMRQRQPSSWALSSHQAGRPPMMPTRRQSRKATSCPNMNTQKHLHRPCTLLAGVSCTHGTH